MFLRRIMRAIGNGASANESPGIAWPRTRAGRLPSAGAGLAALLLSACGAPAPRTAPAPAAPPAPLTTLGDAPRFPPVPAVTGPVTVRVTYPPDGATIVARDSTFLFGSVGTGDARLTVNGADIPVLPNGAWLAWVPLPPRERPEWLLVASKGGDTVRTVRRMRFPALPLPLPNDGVLRVDSASLRPARGEARRSNDPVRLSVRAPANATVSFQGAEGTRRTLRRAVVGGADSTVWVTEVAASALQEPGRLVVARGADTVSLSTTPVSIIDSAGARYAIVGERLPAMSPTAPDSDRVVNARPVAAGGTYKWFLIPQSVVELTGRSGAMARLRLDRDLEVWVDSGDVRELPEGQAPPVRVAGNARLVARGPEVSDLVIPMAAAPPYSVQLEGDRLLLDLYGTVANTDILRHDSADSVVQRVTWEQRTSDRARYTVQLRAPLLGYLVRWERGALVLKVRRAPRVDSTRPLQGLTIAVDAGHPPAGSTGPTGLYEGVATLEIARRLEALLVARGARVVMTRTTADPLGLTDRPEIARRAGAHAFVSIHLNALPDGVNPFTAHGTGSYWFTAHSEPLAREVQRGMVRRMGLRDLGSYYDNLAVLRPTWMPAVLCEGAFVMLPEQEALLRMPEFQAAYALGVAEGLERYFRELARP